MELTSFFGLKLEISFTKAATRKKRRTEEGNRHEAKEIEKKQKQRKRKATQSKNHRRSQQRLPPHFHHGGELVSASCPPGRQPLTMIRKDAPLKAVQVEALVGHNATISFRRRTR